MSDTTPRLGLATVGDHSQKRLVMNEALMRLDSLVQARVLSRTTPAEPGSPADGDAYILPASPTGVTWGALSAGTFVRSESATWETVAFPDGAMVHVADENRFVLRIGGSWTAFEDTLKALDNLQHLGIGTTADSYNLLALKGAAALLSAKPAADGGSGDIALVLDKETAGDTAQVLFQTGYSGRAVLGLLGNNNLTLKVSPDGSTFVTALTVNNTTGAAAFGAPVNVPVGSVTSPGWAMGSAGLYQDLSTRIALTLDNIAAYVVWSNTGNNGFRYASTGGGYNFTGNTARGTASAPAALQLNDTVYRHQAQGYTGAAYTLGGYSQITVAEPTASVSATSFGCRFSILLNPVGSATPTETMRIEPATGLSMFGANPVIDQNRNVRSRIYTVATLPTAATAAGQRAQVSDASSPAFAAAVSGGGSIHSPVYSDGSTWRCG